MENRSSSIELSPELAKLVKELHSEAKAAQKDGNRALALAKLRKIKVVRTSSMLSADSDEENEQHATPSASEPSLLATSSNPPSDPFESLENLASSPPSSSAPSGSEESNEKEEWLEYKDDEGESYFFERHSRKSVWERPEGVEIGEGVDLDDEEIKAANTSSSFSPASSPPPASSLSPTSSPVPTSSPPPQESSSGRMKRLSSNPLEALGGIRRRSSLLTRSFPPDQSEEERKEHMKKTLEQIKDVGNGENSDQPAASTNDPPNSPSPKPTVPTPQPTPPSPTPPSPPNADPGCAADWERIRSVTFGDGSGTDNDAQVYYINKITGETSWELPDVLRSSVDEIIGEGVEWDGMNGSDEDFGTEVLGIAKLLSFSGTDSVIATQPLKRLCDLSQTCGSEEEWVELIEGGDFILAAGVARVVEAGVMSGKREVGDGSDLYYCEGFSFAVRNLILFSKLHPQVWGALEKPFTVLVLDKVSEALLESMANHGLDDERGINGYADFSADEECTVNLMLLQEAFSNSPEGTFVDAQESVKKVVSAVIACLKVASEELFVTCGLVMVHANNREDAVIDDASNQNIIMKDFMAADGVAASSVIEVCLLLLNENGYPNTEDFELLRAILVIFKSFFETPETSVCFYTNDLNVLVDIVLREATNLPPESHVRANFVEVVHLILVNTDWGMNGKYRSTELLKMLESFIDMGERGVGRATIEATEMLLGECLELLELDE